MKKLFASLAVLAAAAALLVPSGPAEARPASVTVADMAFSAASVTVAVGESVTWTFEDPVSHTSTSDQGFWDSGTRSGGATYSRAFTSAGTFAYHCTIHPMMRGKVSVAVAVKGHRITWASARTAGLTYDVQTKLGSGRWVTLQSGTATTSAKLAKKGTYLVRARTDQGSSRSGWSPTVAVSIS
jgi:plastocyanin